MRDPRGRRRSGRPVDQAEWDIAAQPAVLAARLHRNGRGHDRNRAGHPGRAVDGQQFHRAGAERASTTASRSIASCPTSSCSTATRAATARADRVTRFATRSTSGPTSAARSGMALDWKDTGGSQYFITHSPQPHLDDRYTVFGYVVNGMDDRGPGEPVGRDQADSHLGRDHAAVGLRLSKAAKAIPLAELPTPQSDPAPNS